MTIKLTIMLRLRAVAVALALAISWLSAPLSLGFWEPDVCEMECCIVEGHCCCAPRHAYVKGREPKPGDLSLSIETRLTNRCPAGCAASGTTARNKLPRAAQSQVPFATITYVPSPLYQDQFLFDHQFVAQPTSPRAPPAYDGLIA